MLAKLIIFGFLCSYAWTVTASETPEGEVEISEDSADEYVLIDNSFSCEGRIYGYYADVNNDCQVFHVCYPLSENGTMIKYSFMCNNETIFDQKTLTCNIPQESYPCTNAESMYHVNEHFGRTPSPEVRELFEQE